jgi:hypothetical protein
MYSFHFLVFFCVLLKLLFCSGRFYISACTRNFHTSSVVYVYPSHFPFLSLIIWKCQIAKQNLATGRETRISKKARRDKGAMDFFQSSVQATTALNMMKRPNSKKISVVRRRNEWDLFEPVVEILSEKEVEALYMREERNARLKKRQEEKDDAFMSRYVRV